MSSQEELIEKLQIEVADYKERWLRTEAEFQNYQKRIARDEDATRYRIQSEILKKFLPILDDISLAVRNRAQTTILGEAILLIERKLLNCFLTEGVVKFGDTKTTFDPAFHEAISQEPSNAPRGTIIEVIQSGFVCNGKVLRPAKVRVAQ